MEAVVSNIRKAQAATGESVNICTLNCKKIKLICYRCDSSHCALCTAQCHEYGRVGHIKKICHSKKTPRGWGCFKYKRSSKPPFTQAGQSKNSKPVRAVQNVTTIQTDEYPLHNIDFPEPLLYCLLLGNSERFTETSRSWSTSQERQKCTFWFLQLYLCTQDSELTHKGYTQQGSDREVQAIWNVPEPLTSHCSSLIQACCPITQDYYLICHIH